MTDTTDDTTPTNPFAAGTPERAEWAAIAAMPSWHGRSIATRQTAIVTSRRDTPDPDPEQLRGHARDLLTLSSAGVIFGPDVSQYQGKPNWYSVRTAGLKFGIYKVSEGRTFLDPSCAYNKAAIPAAGLVAGGYHYLYYSSEYADKPSAPTTGTSSTSKTRRRRGITSASRSGCGSTGGCSRRTR
jgi:hypothetical protein